MGYAIVKMLPPAVTTAVTTIGSLGAAVAGIPAAAHHFFGLADPLATLFGAIIGAKIAAAGAIIALVSVPIAGAGRSFIKSIDNPQK